jgi:transcriptional regulator with XRE-family HTH domain
VNANSRRLTPLEAERRQALGVVVRRRRAVLELSQEALARRAGCDRQSINRVENAAYSPSLDRVVLLADALGVDVGELFADVAVVLRKNAERRQRRQDAERLAAS